MQNVLYWLLSLRFVMSAFFIIIFDIGNYDCLDTMQQSTKSSP